MLALILTTLVATASPSCSWNDPGANRFTGDEAAAVNDYALPADVKARLQQRIKLHTYDEVVSITRETVQGGHADYANLRDMHFGYNRLCHGLVDRTKWTDKTVQMALVYCEGDTCVVVPAICGNVALVDRKPQEGGDEPIDIEPAAGPTPLDTPAPIPDPIVTASTDTPPTDTFTVPPDDGGGYYFPGGGGGGYPGGGGGGGGGGGCGCTPPPGKPPVTPPGPPPSCVPEPGSVALLLSGLALLIGFSKRKQR